VPTIRASRARTHARAHEFNVPNEERQASQVSRGRRAPHPGPPLGRARQGGLCAAGAGQGITWKEALRRHPSNPDDPNHTFFFHLDDKHVIDAGVGGNAARWINHACKPNCEADEVDGRVFIKALRDIEPGEELFYDYGLTIDAKYTKKLKREYACRCGARKCRGTMLAPKT
jgi:hypothetical protein